MNKKTNKSNIYLYLKMGISLTAILIAVAIATSCAPSTTTFIPTHPNCWVTPLQDKSGYVITCPDGSIATVHNGTNGTNGTSCSASTLPSSFPYNEAPNGGTLISCTDGTTSLLLNGANGVNTTLLQPVQFCPNKTTVFPSTFNEVGFCINNSLYAVYSANGGFLSLIPPGHYSSNGINSTCSFTVGNACQISYP